MDTLLECESLIPQKEQDERQSTTNRTAKPLCARKGCQFFGGRNSEKPAMSHTNQAGYNNHKGAFLLEK